MNALHVPTDDEYVCPHDQGALRVVQARWYEERRLDACTMEAIARKDGLNLAKQHDEQMVMPEIDCLEFINM